MKGDVVWMMGGLMGDRAKRGTVTAVHAASCNVRFDGDEFVTVGLYPRLLFATERLALLSYARGGTATVAAELKAAESRVVEATAILEARRISRDSWALRLKQKQAALSALEACE